MTFSPEQREGDDNPRQPSEGVLGNVSSADTTASAAITAATSFGMLNNGAKYYYSSTSATAADTAVTVNTSATHGSASNPFVIDSKERWVFFANVITNQTSGYTGTSKYWVLNADIDLGGNAIYAVGRHATGFQGTLYGNRHTIKNGTITYQTWIGGTSHYAVGLFHYIAGGKVYDLTIDSTIKLTMATPNASVYCYAGGLTAVSSNATMVGIYSNVSFSSSNTSTTAPTYCSIGGISGLSYLYTSSFYKCSYNGSLYFKTAGSTTWYSHNEAWMGGITGCVATNGSLTIDQCSITGTIEMYNAGGDVGCIVGRIQNASTSTVKISNVVINANAKCTYSDTAPGLGMVYGWDGGGTWTTASSISNVYILGGLTYAAPNCGSAGQPVICHTADTNLARLSNICFPVSSGVLIRLGANGTGTNVDSQSGVQRKGSTSAVASVANSNTSITNNFTVSTAGAITPKNVGASANIAFHKGSGSTGGASDTTYTYNANAQNKTLTAPTRTGYTFKGWSLTGYQGAVSGTTSYLTIPAGQRGNINVYAVWEVNAFTGTAPSDVTIVYGSNATFSAAGLSSPPGTSSSTYGVNISYQWKNSAGTAIIPPPKKSRGMTFSPEQREGADNPRQPSEGVLGNVSSADTTASAATITAASSFSKFTNGSKYYYTNTTTSGQTTITVNTSATWGAQTNPYVINTKEQWQLFVNTIASSASAGTSANNSNGGYAHYALGADIDLGGCTVEPVGKGTAGFFGIFFGNKHTIKNGTFSYGNSPYGGDAYHCSGLFNTLYGSAGVYDVMLDSTLKISVPMGNSRHLLIGGLSGWTGGTITICNVVSKVTINLSNSSTTQAQVADVGGIVGSNWSSSVKIYKSMYSGTITFQAAGSNIGNDNSVRIGGIIGRAGLPLTIDCCAVTGTTITERYGGVNVGAIVGQTQSQVNITNTVVSATLSLPATNTTPDIGSIIGCATVAPTSGSAISDVYIIGGNYTNQIASTNSTVLNSSAGIFSNIQTCATTSATVYPTALASKVTKNGTTAATVTKAVADAQVNAIFSISSTGTVYSRLWQGALNFNKGSGSTGGPSNTVYNPSTSAQNVTLTAPSRTGYTFKGWSLTGYQGSVSGTTSYLTIPANTAGDITAYAVWEVNAFTGTAPSDVTIVYGSNATFSAAGLSSPPGTSSSTYGVNISYQWKNSAGTAIIRTR